MRIFNLAGLPGYSWDAYGVINDGGGPGQRTGDGAYIEMEKRTHPSN